VSQAVTPSPHNEGVSTSPELALLERLAHGRPGRLLHVHRIPERPAQLTAWPGWLPAEVISAYAECRIAAPWQHQVSAAEHAYGGAHVALATGTASGKSLGFGMVALARIHEGRTAPDGRGATALYLSPTKALANDQLRSLDALALPWLRAATYDGDTPPDERAWVRRHANYVLSNPDLLHHSLLPGHEAWSSFVKRLAVIVVDEAHTYRGVLGSHVSAVLRRLRRVAAHYGAQPVVIVASATMANPGQAVARLIGSPAVAVTDDASPRPPMTMAFWEPPLLAEGRPDQRRSALQETADLLADCVIEDRQALAFIRSRKGAEAVAMAARDLVIDIDPALAPAVAAYRGGYLPEERRELEAALRAGAIKAMATTSALEMGIDVSGLDVVITTGWPGTRASLWQQFGRAGRATEPALGIFVARDDPLDSFIVHHPEVVTDADVEATIINAQNPFVLAPHLCAAAAEVPLTEADLEEWFGPTARSVVDDLVEQGLLRRRPTGWFWTLRERASDLTDLRGSGGVPVRVVEEGTGRLLGTVDRAAAAATVHRGAVYLHQGVTHVVTSLDLDDAVATVVEQDVDYTTTARSISDIRILGIREQRRYGAVGAFLGTVEVASQVVSFQRRRPNGESLGEELLDLPVQQLQTTAVWWTMPELSIITAGVSLVDIPGAAHAAEHAAIGLLPLFATCDRWDIGGVSTACHLDTGQPTIFVYDGYPGGAGFAEHGFEELGEWLTATRATIAECSCAEGCPACVQSPKCGNGNSPLDKQGSVALLDLVLDHMSGVALDVQDDRAALADQVGLMRDSLRRLTGRDLLDYAGAPADPVQAAAEAPFALLAHDGAEDPVFTFGNATALQLFEFAWDDFVRLPSRMSAEPLDRDERQRLLDQVAAHGYIDNYSGIRISATGRRFVIGKAVVWNLTDADGTPRGQAAMFADWTPLDEGR
jgi:DEAD/DEAH box helicase domain-containing protein